MPLPVLPAFKLNGPFWTADAELLRLATPTRAWDLRELFVDLTSRGITPSKALLPGTALVLCWVRSVQLKPTTAATPVYNFTRRAGETPPAETLSPAEVKSLLLQGQVALLLVEANPAQWQGEDPSRLGTVTCLSGHISLDVLRGDPASRSALYNALELLEAVPASDRPGAAALPGGLSVHATGATIFGSARLPWEGNRITAPYQLTRVLPDPNPNLTGKVPSYRLTIELERTTDAERATLTAAWRRFATSIDPGNPAVGRNTVTPATRWVTLEVANPAGIPRMYWFIQPWKAVPSALPLHLERDELNLVLSDQSLFDQQHRATTLARTVLGGVVISRSEPGGGAPARITVAISAVRAGTSLIPGQLQYHAVRSTAAGDDWQEQFALSGAVTAFDPIETPRVLRENQDLMAPSWVPGEDAVPLEPAALWAFSPLEEGWAQLPVPNLTTQMYVDARLAREPTPTTALLTGAASYGNDKSTAPEISAEQTWTMTVIDADSLTGTWTLLQQGTTEPVLTEIALTLTGPEVSLTGLLWLARGRPTIEDALPSLENWVTGLFPVALRTVDPEVELIPPLATVSIPQLTFSLRADGGSAPSALLGAWSLTLGVDPLLFRDMVSAKLLPADLFGGATPRGRQPLVWRRHRTLPMIQALPLTQRKNPPNHPSPSRQLVPFELPVALHLATGLWIPSSWTFGRPAGNGAAAWPTVQGAPVPAHEWRSLADLPLAALSLPGLVLDPHAVGRTGLGADTDTTLPQQYRHDLPYADEPHALAQLPKLRRSPDDGSATAAPTSAPAGPLTRDQLAGHFRSLSERASLAALDAVAATSAPGELARVDAIVEPLAWQVTATLTTSAYPGALTFTESGGRTLTLQGEAALAGISGRFEQHAGDLLRLAAADAGDAFQLVGGSMATKADPSGFRDQRGLLRGATATSPRVVRTPVQLVGEADTFELTSLLEAIPLAIGPSTSGPPTSWRLWFRDLPVSAGSFLRDRTRSPLAQDINDPEAGSRRFNFLGGWEWRLEPDAPARYSLFGLDFFPLTLEKVVLAHDDVQHLELIGRLQLPVTGAGELDALANAVRLTFDRNLATGHLELSAVNAAGGAGEWPLAPTAGTAGEAPRIIWPQLTLTATRDGVQLDGAELAFQLFDATWRIPLARLVFGRDAAAIVHRYTASAAPSEPLVPRQLELTLDPGGADHAVSLLFGVRLGRGVTTMVPGPRPVPLSWTKDAPLPDPRLDGVRAAFTGDVRFQVLGASADSITWLAGFLFDDIALELAPASPAPEAATFLAGETSLHFRWDRYLDSTSARLQLLPGMHLATGIAPGFATAVFRTFSAANDVPTLHLTSSFVEALFRCRWGEALQEPAGESSNPLARVCGSSAGDLIFGYTGESQETTWDEQSLLNGFLELKDLVSWPTAMIADAPGVRLTLPAVRAPSTTSLDHLRHTVRILFDQHALPPGVLETDDGDLIFRLAPQKGWRFLAVVEHQLVEILPGPAFTTPQVRNDRRWVAVQEVRFMTPAGVKAELLAIKNDALKLQAPVGGTVLVGDASYGVFGAGLRTLLTEGAAPALDALPGGTMIVETSAAHWLKELPVTTSAPTALQYLPNGTQLAALSSPEDYAPTDPRDPAWLLVTMPFLGRLQDRARDALALPLPPGTPAPVLLQVDPVLELFRRKASPAALPPLLLAFTAWAESTPVTITFSALDNAVGRTFARLDPRALEESWFYAQNSAYEPLPEGIRSVMATASESVARLGRPTTLAHLYGGARGFYPPQWSPDGDPVVPSGTDNKLIWRPSHLFVLQTVASQPPATSPPYGWLAVGLQLLTGLLRRTAGTTFTSRRHVAATQIPLRLAGAQVPSGLVVSPFLSLELRPAPAASDLRVVIAELLAINGASGRLRPVASQSWESTAAIAGRERELATAWARETHRRLSPESPVAVLRYRELRSAAAGAPSTSASLITSFGFGLVSDVQAPRTLARRVFRLRSPVSQLRFRDGHFGGAELPGAIEPFELAPPQTTSVQPLRLDERPTVMPPTATETAWPWGFAGLRTSIHFTDHGEGVAGRTTASDPSGITLWWQGLHHAVQYRSALGADPAAGLPPDFRSPAIRGFLPVLPALPLPGLDASGLFPAATSAWRQPILPGSIRTTVVGARPGAFLSLRPQLTRQSGLDASAPGPQRGATLTSGSVPVQHRAPRPVSLPPNDPADLEHALQPWASWFAPQRGLVARTEPTDEAFFAASATRAAQRLQLKLVSPARGQLEAGWDGVIVAELAFDGTFDEWALSIELLHGGRAVPYSIEPPADRGAGRYTFRPAATDAPNPTEAFFNLLSNLTPGDLVELAVRVTRAGADGFFQTLSLPMRAVDLGAPHRLPLEPFFILFEDPEYNRLLASPSNHSTGLVKTLASGQVMMRSVTLTTDRAEYDPTSQLAVRYDWEDDRSQAAELFVDLIDLAGLAHPLTLRGARAISLPAHTLQAFPLAALRNGDTSLQLTGGETLILKLRIPAVAGTIVEQATIAVAVSIVARPVTPVPQAAYALLRRQVIAGQEQVECVRFAWSPPATRVELVCPDDLRTGIVRRRAVFLWTDTARAATATGFAVQKITLSGSTHFPEPSELERPSAPLGASSRASRR